MAQSPLEALRLSREQARRAADFYESCAASAAQLRDPRGESLSRGGNLSQSGAGGAGSAADLDWAAQADAATALRLAGQWAMLFDVQHAHTLLADAGRRLHTLGQGFGTFLVMAYGGGTPDPAEVASRVRGVAGLLSRDEEEAVPGSGEPPSGPPPAPLLHPQQQAYLLVGASGMAGLLRRPGSGTAGPYRDPRVDRMTTRLRFLVSESPHRRGVVSVGALGTPIHVYWNIANHLLSDEPGARGPTNATDATDSTDAIVGHLRAMAERYAEAVTLAMANERLWFHGAAPLDVCDIDITALALIAARSLGTRRVRSALREARTDAPALMCAALDIAAQMIPEAADG
jgi:hypothetical protein